MRTDSNSKLRVFDRTTRLMHWLTAGLMLLVFVLAFSVENSGTSNSAHSSNSTYPRSPLEHTYKGHCYESIGKSFMVTDAFQLLVPADA
jgi:hypothetical protein